VRSVVIDANVLVSFFVERDETQRAAAKALLLKAVDGEITAIIPQFVVFEISYVFQTMYGATGERLATLAWTTFAVILIVVRMAKKILLAVELSGMGGHLEPKPMTLRA